MLESCFLAIDCGTQSVRAFLFDPSGNVVASHRVTIEPYFSCQPGWAEQAPEYYWDKLGEACRALWQEGGAKPSWVKGLAVTTQRGTVVNLDRNGHSLRPAITWLDRRITKRLKPMPMHWQILTSVTGKRKAVANARQHAESNWILAHQADIWSRTEKYLLLSGYLNYRLTGEFRDAVSSQVGYIPFDYKTQRWANSRHIYWPMFSIKRRQLPTLVPSTSQLGRLTSVAAEHLGLPSAVPVIAAGADKACEMIGNGSLAEDQACLSFGTRATVSVHTGRYCEIEPNKPAYPALLPAQFIVEAGLPSGFWMVEWFAKELDCSDQTLFFDRVSERQITDIPAGADGLVLQPYWGRDIEPDPEARGAIVGFTQTHTRAHMYRAMLEGLMYALRESKEKIEKRGRLTIKKLQASGGGTQSDLVMQIAADVFAMEVTRPQVCETSSLGAAIAVGIGLGYYPDYRAAVSAMTSQQQIFLPSSQASAVYAQIYKKVYRRLYPPLKPLYKTLNCLGGSHSKDELS